MIDFKRDLRSWKVVHKVQVTNALAGDYRFSMGKIMRKPVQNTQEISRS